MRIRTSDNKEQQIEELTYVWKYRCVASKNFVSMMARLLASTQMTKGISQVQVSTMTNSLIKTSSVSDSIKT